MRCPAAGVAVATAGPLHPAVGAAGLCCLGLQPARTLPWGPSAGRPPECCTGGACCTSSGVPRPVAGRRAGHGTAHQAAGPPTLLVRPGDPTGSQQRCSLPHCCSGWHTGVGVDQLLGSSTGHPQPQGGKRRQRCLESMRIPVTSQLLKQARGAAH